MCRACCIDCPKQAKHEDRGKLKKAVPKTGIQLQTMYYRAPEVLFGNEAFGTAIDIWSLGVCLIELCGFDAFHQCEDEASYAKALFLQLGTPEVNEFKKLPGWPRAPANCNRREWPSSVVSKLGNAGIKLVNSLLHWEATRRPRAFEV